MIRLSTEPIIALSATVGSVLLQLPEPNDAAPQWFMAALFGGFVVINFLEKIDKLPGQKKLNHLSSEDKRRLQELYQWMKSVHGLMTYRGETGVERFIRQDQTLNDLSKMLLKFDSTANRLLTELEEISNRLDELEK